MLAKNILKIILYSIVHIEVMKSLINTNIDTQEFGS